MTGPIEITTPRIDVPGTFNFREAAAGAEHPTIRPRFLYRADALDRLGEPGRAALSALGIKRVIDLRATEEQSHMPDDLGDLPVEVVHLPISAGTPASTAVNAMSLTTVYGGILERGGNQLATALRAIATSTAPVVVHCTAGKDRTGVVIALALLLAGVDRDTVIADYAGTEANLAGAWTEGMLAKLSSFKVAVTPEILAVVTTSPAATLIATLETIESKHGSIEGYLALHGFTPDDVAALRATLAPND